MSLENWEIDFPQPSGKCDVSIIVCAFNKWEYTLTCLSAIYKSLAQNISSVEVILVDDASTDRSHEVFSTIRGLKYVSNITNRGFLQSANVGAAYATGEFIIFLNNDTEPIGNWIDPLVRRARSSERIGAVGSKLIYPDGSLQEAGGIIFHDASGWNYGKHADSKHPSYNYARKVDYCSGASLLVRRKNWVELGGFDERYIPAYYEDTDFCFQLHNRELEVWYEPLSLVLHHEGISHGTDESAGLKTYQLANKEKFYQKWQELLKKQPEPDATKIGFAARSNYQRRILLIDHQIPTPDQDSGSLRIFEIMRSLIDSKQHVTFLPENGLKMGGYCEKLQEIGVEVLWGNEGELTRLIAERADSLDVVWISRPGPARHFFKNLKELLPNVPIIYDTVDLHFQRVRRQSQLNDSEVSYADSLRVEIDELDIISRSAAAVAVSDVEKKLLNERSSTLIRVIGNVHRLVPNTTSLYSRSDLLFVGGFAHQPNEDAVAWFIEEIFPLVIKSLPNCRLRIVGSKVPQWLLGLQHSNIDVIGWVENVDEIYLKSRLSIAPLRYGAGVKGKVGESLSMSTPMVVTDIAAEGLFLEDTKHALIANDPEDFAKAIIKLMTDDSLWTTISVNGRKHIEEKFGVSALSNSLSELLKIVKPLESQWL
ncbi:MAG: glycosyltransferase [Candidatus Planktophila sp.]